MRKTVSLILLSLLFLPLWAQMPTNLHERLVYSGIDFDQINMNDIMDAVQHPVIITIGGVSFRGTVGPDSRALSRQRVNAEVDNAVKELMDETGINMGFLQRMKTLEDALRKDLSTSTDEKRSQLYQELFSTKNMLTVLSYVFKAGGIFYSPLGMASSALDKASGRATAEDMGSTLFQTAASEIATGYGHELEEKVMGAINANKNVTGKLGFLSAAAQAGQDALDWGNAGYQLAQYLDETAGWSFRDKEKPFGQYWQDLIRLDAFYHAVPRRALELLAKKYDLGWKISCNTWHMNKDKSLFGTPVKQAWHMNCDLKRVGGEPGSIFGYRGVFQGSMNIDIYCLTEGYDEAFMASTVEKTDLVQQLRQAPLNLSDKTLEPTTLVKYLSSSDFIVDTSGGGQTSMDVAIKEEAGESNVLIPIDLGQFSDNTVFHLSHQLEGKVHAGAYNNGVLQAGGITGKADVQIDITADSEDKRVYVLYGQNQQDESFVQFASKTFQGSWVKMVGKTILMTDRDIFSDLNGPAQMLIE